MIAQRQRVTQRSGMLLVAMVCGGGICCGGCRCGSEAPAPAASTNKAEASACTRSGGQLTLSAGEMGLAEPEVEATELPFAVELGSAAVLGGAFYVTASRAQAKGEMSLLARLAAGTAAGAGEISELGALRGNSAPARVAGDGKDLIVALLDGDASGRNLRLGRVQRQGMQTQVNWGPEQHQGGDESSAFDVKVREGMVLAVWDDWNKSANHGVIQSAVWSLERFSGAAVVSSVSAAGRDAEAPRLATRAGGYWLAWLVNGSRPHSSAAAAKAKATGTSQVAKAEGLEQEPVLSNGERWLELVPLDERGKPLAEARRVTSSTQPIAGFDLTAGPDGQAWLAWREGADAAIGGGRVLMAVVDAGGASHELVVEDEALGSGTPSWLSSDPSDARRERWLSFVDSNDRIRLLYVDKPDARPRALALGRELRAGTALAASGSELLFATPRGRSLELALATCSPHYFDAGLP